MDTLSELVLFKLLINDDIKCKNILQSVPRNMTIARRLESRLWYLNLFVTFSLLSTLTWMKQLSHNSPSPGISKKWSAFFVLSILPEI